MPSHSSTHPYRRAACLRRATPAFAAMRGPLVAALMAALLGGCVTASDRWTSAGGDVQWRVGDRLAVQRAFTLDACTTETSTFQFWTGGSRKRCVQARPSPQSQGPAYAPGTVARIVAIKERGMADAQDSLLLLQSDAWRGTVVADADVAQRVFVRQE